MDRGRQSFICAAAAAGKVFDQSLYVGKIFKKLQQNVNSELFLEFQQLFKSMLVSYSSLMVQIMQLLVMSRSINVNTQCIINI